MQNHFHQHVYILSQYFTQSVDQHQIYSFGLRTSRVFILASFFDYYNSNNNNTEVVLDKHEHPIILKSQLLI